MPYVCSITAESYRRYPLHAHMHACMHSRMHARMHARMHTHFMALWTVWDYPCEPVPEQIWILLKQETVSGSGISWAICKSAPCSRKIIMPAPIHSVFTGPSCHPTNSIKALKAEISSMIPMHIYGGTQVLSISQNHPLPSHCKASHLHCVPKEVYHPTTNNNFNSSNFWYKYY